MDNINIPVFVDFSRSAQANELSQLELIHELYLPLELANPNQIDIIVSYVPDSEFQTHAQENYAWFNPIEWEIKPIVIAYNLLSWRNMAGIGNIDTTRTIEYAIITRRDS